MQENDLIGIHNIESLTTRDIFLINARIKLIHKRKQRGASRSNFVVKGFFPKLCAGFPATRGRGLD